MSFTGILAFLHNNWVQMAIAVIMLNVEYFLGRTDLVPANSTLELILNGIDAVAKKIKAL